MRKAQTLRSFLLVGLIGSTVLGHIAGQSGGNEDIDLLARHVDGAKLEYVSTVQAGFKALVQAGAPGGIVRILGCEGDGIIHRWQPLGSSLRDVLDGIVKSDPQYRWIVEDKVINVVPAADELALLKTRIREFKVEDAVWPGSAMSKLMATPEVRASLNKLGLNEALKAGSFPAPQSRKVGRTVQCSNVTLRQALNVIARTFGNAVWFYRENHCNGKDEYEIDFIVE